MGTENEMKRKDSRLQNRLFIIIILSISILFGLLTTKNDAANTTNETNNTNNTATQASSNSKSDENTTSKTTAKSSNANLSDLGITPHDFTGFKYGTTSYKVTVPEDTETVEVYAKTQDSKAKVAGTGKKNLEKGENKVEVVVTAEDGTKKTYTINIVREAEQKTDEDMDNESVSVENANGLSELKINNLSLSPEFKTNVYEYTVKYIGEDTKLNIETKPTNENYIVEVTGNDNLQEGENIVNILVSEANGENVATYQITVNKSLVDEEAIAREEAEKKEQQKKIMIGAIIAVIILAIIIFIIIINKRNKNLAEEFSGVSFYGRDDNDEEYEEEIPRGLRKERTEQDDMDKHDDDYEEYEEDEIEKMPKEKIKEKFLNNYNSNYEEEYGEEYKEPKRKKHKGKRFK